VIARRLIGVVAVAAAVGGMVAADRSRPDAAEATFGAAEVPLMPEAPRSTALSSTWYCAGVPATADGPAAEVAVVNAGDVDLAGTVTAFPVGGEAVTAELTVGPGARTVVDLRAIAPSELTGALVEVLGGSVVAEQAFTVDGALQAAPCSSTASTTWFVADGDTRVADAEQNPVGATMALSVLNPFDADAVVDFAFSTAEGFTTRQDLEGFVIPARSLVRIPLDDRIRRTSQIAVVATTRTGRVVMQRIQTYDGAFGRGTSYALGVPRTTTSWWFPDGRKGDGVRQRLSVWNPGEDEATVTVELRLDAVEELPVEPIQLTVPPQGTAQLDLSAEAAVPVGAFSVDVTSDGLPVVAEMTTAWFDPADRRGLHVQAGAPQSALRWLLPSPVAVGVVRDEVRLSNPTGEAAVVDVLAVAPGGARLPLPGATGIELPPGASVTVDLLDPTRAIGVELTLDVVATGAIVAQRVRSGPVQEGLGASWAPLGIPALD
jgi:hypothetical protein